MTVVANVTKVQTDMSCQSEYQTLTKQSMRHKVCHSEICHTAISVSIMTILMSRGRRN